MENSTNKILVPIDFSEQSMIALKQSYNLAKIYNAEIVLIYVFEKLNPMMKMFFSETKGLKEAVTKNLLTLAEDTTKETGLLVSTHISKGVVHAKIVKAAKKMNVKMIVMGTQGGNRSKFIGSNALRVVKTAPCPVITIKGKVHKKGCDSILLPLDLTKATADKVNIGIKLAQLFGSEIIAISIILEDKNEEYLKLEQQINEVKQKIEANNINCKTELIKIKKDKDTMVNALLTYAEKKKIDLIVIMTQQENEFKELFIGSKAQAIINHSEIPVLSVLPQLKYDNG